MAEIHTVVKDIYKIAGKVPLEISVVLSPKEPKGALRLSQMGPWCPRALWHSVHKPELEQPLLPHTQIKFNYGHMVEALALKYAKAAGHRVEGEQDELSLDGVTGHRDCVMDGCVVDVKSCSSRQFEKFKTGSIRENDLFGYLDQLDGYLVASFDDPLVTVKDRGYLLAIDQTLGHMVLYEHHVRESSIRARVKAYKDIVNRDTPPACECGTEPDGKGGNIKLGTRASYSNFKYTCFPNLRTFLYSDGPRYLTKVVKRPMNLNGPIPEVDRHGKFVYNIGV